MNKTRVAFSLLLLVLAPVASLSAGPIQNQIDAAQEGAVIEVPAGVYGESITLKDWMTLVGAGADATIIDGQGTDCVVHMGKNSAIIGCGIRNGRIGVLNNGRYIGVFECDVKDVSEFGIRVEGGSACVANNLLAAGTNATGIACIGSNPYVGYNVIRNNKVGLSVEMEFIPVVDHNVFESNEAAIAVGANAKVELRGNVYSHNGNTISGQNMGDDDAVRDATADELVPHRGSSFESYRQLMKKVFDEATALHPKVTYDLADTPGRFHLVIAYPWATFSVLASARDTVIEAYDAYDSTTDKDLKAQYAVMNGHPGVAVMNPEIADKNLDRFILEKIFVHPASFQAVDDKGLVFDRQTNISRIEVLLPPGYTATEMNPGASVEQRGDRQVVKMTDVGLTRVHIAMRKQ